MTRSEFNGFREGNYFVTWRPSCQQLERVHQLRADVFCHELGWVKPARQTERDEFDQSAVHIVLSDEYSYALAAIRLLHHDVPWMLDTVFRNLWATDAVLKHRDTMEVSRLAVSKEARNLRLENGRRLVELLYKGVYMYSKLHAVRHLYMVTSNVVHRHLNSLGLPCEALAPPQRMQDGVLALVAKLDWTHFARYTEHLCWYQTGCPVEPQNVRYSETPVRGDSRAFWPVATGEALPPVAEPGSYSLQIA